MVNLIKNRSTETGDYYNNQTVKIPDQPKRNYNITIILLAVLVLSALIFVVYFKPKNVSPVNTVVNTKPQNNKIVSTSTSALPENLSYAEDDPFGLGSSTLNLRAEELSFGLFYESKKSDFKPVLKSYDLPINVKSDVRNYFTMARTFNLDPLLEDLNQNGFTIINNSYFTNKDNFFDIYRYFIEKKAPLYFSSDFVLYNFQKTLSDVYKEIEENIFYENLWEINSYLYSLALTRYMDAYSELGDVNDVVLEGKRLELVYFAIALKLLEADESQINRRANFTDPAKFTPQEFDYFSINIPDFITADVEKELKLIQKASGLTKSPALLYRRDYSSFKIPGNYSRNAKLKNYYLARQWYNSNFPLFYQGDECPDCLLDRNDWLINMLAASYIAEDISSSQEIKNKWAEIYKFISYFSGLRHDLTYLHYIDAFRKVWGEDYNLDYIFSDQNISREEDISQFTDYLLAIEFDPVNGGIKRETVSIDPQIGMKILQDAYWPNSYLFSRLTGENMLYQKNKSLAAKPVTVCGEKNKYRCRGIVFDLLDLRAESLIMDDYIKVNRSFSGFEKAFSNLKSELDRFDRFAWNNNIYWSSLDYLKEYLDYPLNNFPTYMQSSKWQQEKAYNTASAAWVNMQLEDDELINYFEAQEKNNFSNFRECNLFNFLEPAPALYDDLSARSEMLAKMIFMLKIPKKTNAASLELKDLKEKLTTLKNISEKELSGDTINGDECSFLNSLAMQYYIVKESAKSVRLDFPENDLIAKISGMNIVVTINEVNGDKILNFGPIFQFSEQLN
jgi:hypothetical protein